VDAAHALAGQLGTQVADKRVLRALAHTPREAFVPESDRARAYEDVALPIGWEQTISQPLVVARMLELLELSVTDRVLDVGTGSGYHAALLARLAREVITIERHPQLSRRAGHALESLGVTNVRCVIGDGSRGWPPGAPFDAINVAAAPGDRPPAELLDQLAPGGRLVLPLGDRRQYLTRIRRTAGDFVSERYEPVRFVPLVRPAPEHRLRR
jgi:protein-L-isoaspartate(D-aspartate) O-methyltransferase